MIDDWLKMARDIKVRTFYILFQFKISIYYFKTATAVNHYIKLIINQIFCLYLKKYLNFQRFYHDYDGFVVLHGTDTTAYGASVLSFMLESVGKTVVLTGAQVSSLLNK